MKPSFAESNLLSSFLQLSLISPEFHNQFSVIDLQIRYQFDLVSAIPYLVDFFCFWVSVPAF